MSGARRLCPVTFAATYINGRLNTHNGNDDDSFRFGDAIHDFTSAVHRGMRSVAVLTSTG